MDNPRTGRRLQAFILLANEPGASDQSFPYQLDHTACCHLRSGEWKGFRGITHLANNGEKQMAESISSLRSDDGQLRSMYHCHHPNVCTMSACYSFVGSRAGRLGESDVLAASETN